MARSAILYTYDSKAFRNAIRPSLVGVIAQVEPAISARASEALSDWLFSTITTVLRETKLKDKKGEIARQLRSGVRITGRGSLASLRGFIAVYPWLIAHEYGARIMPKRSKYLTIPILFGLRPDGSPKFKNARSWKRFGSFVYTSKGTGKKFLAYRSKETGELRILYILVEHSDIPARLGFNKIATRRLGTLLSAWTRIYVQEAARSGVINLWGATQ